MTKRRSEKQLRADADPQSVYDSARANGCSPQLAEMLALRAAPRIMTDAVAFGNKHYMSGRGANPFEGLPAQVVKRIKAKLKKAGVDWRAKKYVSQLARHGEGIATPEAWIEPTRYAMKKALQARGAGAEVGMVTVKPADIDFDTAPKKQKDYRCDKRLIQEEIAGQALDNPEFAQEYRHNKKFAKDHFERLWKKRSGQG